MLPETQARPPRWAPPRPERGFSLMEIMVVLLVMGLIVGLVLPNIGRSLDKMRLRSEAQTLQAVMRYARSRAMTRWTPHAVVIDLDNGTYYLEAAPVEDGPETSDAESAATAAEGASAAASEPPAEDAGEDEVMGHAYTLPEGYRFEHFSFGGQDKEGFADGDPPVEQGVVAVIFQATGAASGGQIELVNDEDKRIRIRVLGLTGRVETTWMGGATS